MNNTQRGTWILTAIVLMIIVTFVSVQMSEKYRSPQSDYRYGLIDTNPVRRTGQFFDTCSPENVADCKRNNPYEGLPLP